VNKNSLKKWLFSDYSQFSLIQNSSKALVMISLSTQNISEIF